MNNGVIQYEPLVNECECPKCVSLCAERPCWGTPSEIRRIMAEGYANRLMYDYWAGGFDGDDNDVGILAPAICGHEGTTAPFWPHGRCTFLTDKNKCEIHAMKPLEGRVAYHGSHGGRDANIHENVARTWNSDEGRSLVKKWRSENE